MFWLIPFTFFVTLTCISDIFSKEYSLKGHWYFWVLALFGYTMGNVFWLWTIRNGSGLAGGAVTYCVINAIFVLIVGLYFYGESTNKVELAGMILAVLSVVLIFWE